ncbi:ATP-binding protein [Streptomyces sp. AJS327]|uniref:ATP-binding protein n=1 Tax=Streptomyces sp. AJS327 TaxID=2545265 RepID=UPI0015DF8441|nr:ATP-binding protein [Streptomyces sp. AJS327]MBA0053055.1 ATP-binding protein [Streptomyces sp. AJS327]
MGTEGSTVLEPLQGLPVLDATTVSSSASCALPPRYEAVKSAREFTRCTLQRWDLSEAFDSVTLVVSELVTNALRHGLPPVRGTLLEPPVRLHLMRWSARLVCAVRDPSAIAPQPPAPPESAGGEDPFAGFAAESGRGLHLVNSFSDAWGWHPLTGGSPTPGKVVWALFRLGTHEPRTP